MGVESTAHYVSLVRTMYGMLVQLSITECLRNYLWLVSDPGSVGAEITTQ